MTYLRPACIVALIILTAASCTELGESRSVSLIDHLDEAKLIPLGAPPPPLPAEPKPFRVVELARDSREAITLPVHSRLALPLEIPRDPEFRFSLATLNPERIELEGVEFTISVVSEGKRSRAFSEILAERQSSSWNERQADVTRWAGKSVILELEASAVPESPAPGQVVAAWGAPVLTGRRHQARIGQAVEMFNRWSRSGGSGIPVSLDLVADTKFSHNRGFYDHPFTVTISTATRGATVVYTLDGSEPSPTHGSTGNSILIGGTTVLRAMAYKQGVEPTNVDTHTYIFPEKVKDQLEHPPEFPERIHSSFLRRRQLVTRWYLNHPDHEESIAARKKGPLVPPNPWMHLDAEIDPDIVTGAGSQEFVEGLLSIPTLSLVMDVDDLFDVDNGIYVNYDKRDPQWERAVSVELIYPRNSRFSEFGGFQADCAVRMHGSLAGNAARKRSFRLLFKKQYGRGKLRYPFFESAVHHAGSAAEEFDSIILRAGGNANWSKEPASEGELVLYTRDQHARDTQLYLSGVSARGIFVHLYLNGIYWGLYNAVERPDQRFFAKYSGGHPLEDWFVINHNGPIGDQPASFRQRWRAMHRFARDNDLADPNKYQSMRTLLDTEHFSDYILQNWIAGMGDWGENNWYGAVRLNPPGKALYVCWDSEYTYGLLRGEGSPVAWVDPLFLGEGSAPLQRLWRELDDSPEFRLEFADRVYRACYNGGPLEGRVNRANFKELCDYLENAIFCESARWGDSARGREDRPRTRDGWRHVRDMVLEEYMEGNVSRFIQALRAHEYYPSIDPPDFTRNGASITISKPRDAERVYYTIDGTDPRGPNAISFSGSKKVVRGSSILKARAKTGDEWSALNALRLGLSSE